MSIFRSRAGFPPRDVGKPEIFAVIFIQKTPPSYLMNCSRTVLANASIAVGNVIVVCPSAKA